MRDVFSGMIGGGHRPRFFWNGTTGRDFNGIPRLCGAAVLSLLIHGLVLGFAVPKKALVEPTPGLTYPVRSLSANLVSALPLPQATDGQEEQKHRPEAWTPQGEGSIDASPDVPPPPPRYYAPSELDERPSIVEFFHLESYAVAPNIEGRAVVQLWVDEKGQVEIMKIEDSTLPSDLVKYLVASRRDLHFSPGRRGQKAVKSIVRYEINLSRAPRERTAGGSPEN